MNYIDRRFTPAIFLTACLALSSCGGDATPELTFSQRCSQLAGTAVSGGKIVSTTLVEASATQPQTCQASGLIVSSTTSTIKFRVDMPVDASWNKKLLHVGGGGFDGSLATAESTFAMFQGHNVRQRGYAIVGSDSGHQSQQPYPNSQFDLTFAYNNTSGFDNYAFAASPQVLSAALSVLKTVYKIDPAFKYFYGQSTGGREALQQAQRYAHNYDGIVALEPVIDMASAMQKAIHIYQTAFPYGGAGWLSPAKVKLLSDAQLVSCDAADGLTDGIIANPAQCIFTPSALRCPGGSDTGVACLSDAQIATALSLRNVYKLPAPMANDVTVAPAGSVGAEADASGGWSSMQLGGSPTQPASAGIAFADQWIKFAVTSDPSATVLGYPLGADSAQWLALSQKVNASNPDLSEFSDHGGKIILWHGWSDHLVPAGYTVDYYASVVAKMGQNKTDSFLRFYMSPGVTHVGTGPGAPFADRLSLLENWVEKGQAPADAVPSSQLAPEGTVLLSRPMCRFPAWPKYKGTGDKNTAESFSCVTN